MTGIWRNALLDAVRGARAAPPPSAVDTSAAVAAVVAVVVAAALALGAAAAPVAAQDTTLAAQRSAALQRAQRLVNDGSGPEGRALMDSLLNRTEPRSPEEAEILFWRATLAESWDQAQRDYLRVMLEHERSPHAGAAMLRLAQGEIVRGDRDAALRYLERIAREAPNSPVRGEAGLLHGRTLFDRGDRASGCAVLRTNRERVPAGALELVNQYDYLTRGCEAVAAVPAPITPPAPAEPVAPPPNPTPSPAQQPVVPPAAVSPAPSGALVWSVQIAAFQTSDEARRFAAEMRERGYDTRVDGTTAPFRVRFGRYPTRAAASTAMEDYKAKERSDAFLAQVPRE